MDFDVGARLREIRSRSGLSQRDLASRAGVPHGLIATVEQNRHSPSVASLRKILTGLPMSMAEFFEPERPSGPQVFFGADELTELTAHLHANGHGSISFRQVGDAREHNLQILHELYAPGSDTGESMLEHEGSEGGIVLAGTLELTVGGETRRLVKGDAYLFDSRIPHRFRNPGDVACEVVSACTPPYL
ncbi:MAG: cupin domain-containing protein [Geminicoccaceae bacterium]